MTALAKISAYTEKMMLFNLNGNFKKSYMIDHIPAKYPARI